MHPMWFKTHARNTLFKPQLSNLHCQSDLIIIWKKQNNQTEKQKKTFSTNVLLLHGEFLICDMVFALSNSVVWVKNIKYT